MCGRVLSPAGHICALPGAWGEPLMSPSCQRLTATAGHQPSGLHNLTKARCSPSSFPPVLQLLALGFWVSSGQTPPFLGSSMAERGWGSRQIWVLPHRTVALQCDPLPSLHSILPFTHQETQRGPESREEKQDGRLRRNACVRRPSLCRVPVSLHVFLAICLPIC